MHSDPSRPELMNAQTKAARDGAASLIPHLKSRAEFHLTMFQVSMEAVDALTGGQHALAYNLMAALDRLAAEAAQYL